MNPVLRGMIITMTTFVLFFVEALLHFNIGKNGGSMSVSIPSGKEMCYIVGVLAVFSILNGLISQVLIRLLG